MKQMVNDWNEKIFECDEECMSDKHGGNIGNSDSEILFIAQTPGQQEEGTKNEDIVPFGFYKKKEDKIKSEVVFHWLTEFLGLTDKDFYLTNVVKCATNKVPNFEITKLCVNKFLIKEIKRMPNLRYIICMGEQARAFVACFKDDFDKNDKYKYFYIWHPSFLSRNGFVDDINRKYGNETIFNKYKAKLISIKEVLNMSDEKEKGIAGKDVEIGKIYQTVGRGTIVKITKMEKKGDKVEFFGITHPKFSLVTVPHDMRLIEVEDKKKYDFSGAEKVAEEAKEEKKEPKEEKKETKEEKKEEPKKEKKEEKEEKKEEPKKEKKEKKEDGEGKRKSKIDRKEMDALYKEVKAHLEKAGGTKVNKNYIVFKIEDIKCRLYQYDCMVLAEKKIKDIEPIKKFDDYVKYPVQDLFKVIGYKG